MFTRIRSPRRNGAGRIGLRTMGADELEDQRQAVADDAMRAAESVFPSPGPVWGMNREDHAANALRAEAAVIKEALRAEAIDESLPEVQLIDELETFIEHGEGRAAEGRTEHDGARRALADYVDLIKVSGATHTLSEEEQGWRSTAKELAITCGELVGIALAMYVFGGRVWESYVLAIGVVAILVTTGYKLGHDSKRLRQMMQSAGTPLEESFGNTVPNEARLHLEMAITAVTAISVAFSIATLRAIQLDGVGFALQVLLFFVFLSIAAGLVVAEAIVVNHHTDIFGKEYRRLMRVESDLRDARDAADEHVAELRAERAGLVVRVATRHESTERHCNSVDAETEHRVQLWRKIYVRYLPQPTVEQLWDDASTFPAQLAPSATSVFRSLTVATATRECDHPSSGSSANRSVRLRRFRNATVDTGVVDAAEGDERAAALQTANVSSPDPADSAEPVRATSGERYRVLRPVGDVATAPHPTNGR